MKLSLSKMLSWIPGVGSEAAPKTNYDSPAFLAEQFRQTNYDREIDEGMSSGMRRLVTLDVTGVSDGDMNSLIRSMRGKCKDFNLCKQLQLAGFNTGGHRYLAVSGESHMFYQGSSSSMFTDRVAGAAQAAGAKSVGYVAMPAANTTDSYEPTNLGRYGTTGAPAYGVSAHPKAAALRKSGEIQ